MKRAALKYLLLIGVVIVAYCCASKLGLHLALVKGSVAPLWPAAGVAVAAVLLWGPRVWPGILIGGLIMAAIKPHPHAASILVAIAGTAQAVVGARLYQRSTGGDGRTFKRMEDVVAFLGWAGFFAPIVSATVGIAVLYLTGRAAPESLVRLWNIWWLGDMLGIIVVVPAVLSAVQRDNWTVLRSRAIEAPLVLILLVLSTALVFSEWLSSMHAHFGVASIVFPFVIWAALRFGLLGASMASIAVSSIAIWGTMVGFGPFAEQSVAERLAFVQFFIAIIAITGLLVTGFNLHRDYVERALRDSAQRLQLAQECAGAGTWEWDIATGRETWSEQCYHLFGLDPATSTPSYDNWLVAVHPDDRAQTALALRDAVARRSDLNAEFRIVHRERGIRWISALGRAIHDSAGPPTRMAGIAIDITDRKRAADALRDSEERFRATFDQAAVGIMLTSMDKRLLQVNDRFCQITGYRREQLMHRPVTELAHPDDREESARLVRRLIDGEIRQFEVEKRYVRPDGSVIWCDVTVTVLRDAAGRPQRMIGVVQDIQERKEAQEQLQAAKAAAEAGSRAKDQFLAALSHELRTPLTPVLATVSALETDPSLDRELRDDLSMIRRNIELEARLIDDLLDLTRIARGKLELHRTAIDVHALIEHAVRVCCSSESVAQRGLHVDLELGAESAYVSADGPRLEQVFWNLINNALKFSPDGQRIVVRSRRLADEQLCFEVVDHGIGIEAEVIPRLFSAFEQGSRDTTRRFGGLGLGLAISKAIVDMHGGSLAARSDGKGCGATFQLTLPAVEAPATAADDDEQRPPMDRRERWVRLDPANAMRQLQLLLVEDHHDTARMMGRLLEADGHRVQIANSVGSALRLAEQHDGRFDLVISDVGLPDGSGLELMRQLKEKYDFPGICLSGYGSEEDRRQSAEAGFAEHLTKPIDVSHLQATIGRVIR